MEEMPWNRASTMMDELVSSQNPNSSVRDHIDEKFLGWLMLPVQAWIIRNAHRVCYAR